MAKQNITGPLREQSDWEQQDENRLGFIKNKPFYDTRKTEEIVVPLNPQKDFGLVVRGEDVAEITGENELLLYRCSDFVPTHEQIMNGYAQVTMGGQTMKAPLDKFGITIFERNDVWIRGKSKLYYASGVAFLLSDEPNLSEAEKQVLGTYLASQENEMGVKLFFLNETGELKQLDMKFMPEGSIPCYDSRRTENITIPLDISSATYQISIGREWIADYTETKGVVIANAYKLSDVVPTFEEYCKAVLVIDGEFDTLAKNPQIDSSADCVIYYDAAGADGGMPVMVVANEVSADILPNGIYGFCAEGEEAIWGMFKTWSMLFPHETGELKQLDEKFLPDGVGGSQPLCLHISKDAVEKGDSTNPYLYKTDDITNETNRITAEELQTAILDGKQIIIITQMTDLGKIYIFPLYCGFGDGHGMLVIDVGELRTLYTA